ncbi:MAG: hypothetical protein DRJ03_07415 [Chloroflexi bacterium]|nr:MAG: hypothetical protein DRJ03_07415 [Chloroflexota bacterium]
MEDKVAVDKVAVDMKTKVARDIRNNTIKTRQQMISDAALTGIETLRIQLRESTIEGQIEHSTAEFYLDILSDTISGAATEAAKITFPTATPDYQGHLPAGKGDQYEYIR